MKLQLLRRLSLGGALLAGLAFFQAGCAPRYLTKTPDNAIRYPYIPVTAEELATYKTQLTLNPKDPRASHAQFWVAQDAFLRQDWSRADKDFTDVFKRFPRSEWAGAARIMAARARVKLKNSLSALGLLHPLLKKKGPDIPEAAGMLSRDIINDELDLAELARVRSSYPDSPWSSQALFVTGKRTLDAGQPDQAIQWFRQFLKLYPASEFASTARELMDKAGRIIPVNHNRIGGLLPLSGPYAPFGKAINQGLELALNEINQRRPENDKLAMTLADSEASTTGALGGLQILTEKEKVLAVIGPALSNAVRALLPELERWQIPVITPSASDSGLVGQSPYLFRYLLTNEVQAETMANYVVFRLGYKRVGILSSEDKYDRSLAMAFDAKARQLGGQITAHLEYKPGTTDFKTEMLALGGVDPGKMKNIELEERKALEQLLEEAAYSFAHYLAPQAEAAAKQPMPQATPIPEKRLAIVRLSETGAQALQEQLGKRVTERFSYSLAAKPGLEVLSQKQTLDAAGGLGVPMTSLGLPEWKKMGETLDVEALVVGEVRQKDELSPTPTPAGPAPSEALPIRYEITLNLISPETGKELMHFKRDWVKRIPPQFNNRQIDAIYLPVSLEDALLIAPQLAFYDLDIPIFGPDAWVSPKLLREGAEALNKTIVATGFWPDDPDSKVQNFVKRFEETYSAPPPLLSVQAYDTMQLVAAVMGRLSSGSTREDFANALRQMREFEGVTGKSQIESNGEIRREPILLMLENGKLKEDQLMQTCS